MAPLCRGPVHLDREADAEEEREHRDELPRDEEVHEPQHRLVEAARIGLDGPAGQQVHRGVEHEQVDHKDPQQGEPAENVQLGDPLGRQDRAELGRGSGSRVQSPTSLSCGTSAPLAGKPAHSKRAMPNGPDNPTLLAKKKPKRGHGRPRMLLQPRAAVAYNRPNTCLLGFC